MSFAFALNPALDADTLARTFGEAGHISIPGFLANDGAEHLRAALAGRSDWNWAINAAGNVYDLSAKINMFVMRHEPYRKYKAGPARHMG